MSKRPRLSDPPDHIYAPYEEEGSEAEPEMEEDDNTESDLDPESETDSEDEAPEDEEPGGQTPEGTFRSKGDNSLWYSTPQDRANRARVDNLKMTPGPTQYAASRLDDIKSSFHLLFPESLVGMILDMTNLEGRREFWETWKTLDKVDLQAYIGLLILLGLYRSSNEPTDSLWNAEFGRPIFRSTMSREQFHLISKMIRIDNKDRPTGPDHGPKDKLAAIRTVWDRWVERLPMMYNPGREVTVGERLLPFKGRCPFKQHMGKKSYGIKMWAACDTKSSYAWNMQIYTGQTVGRPEKNQGMRAVLDMTAGLDGHHIICDNFLTSYALGEELLTRNLTMVGAVRKNKPEVPAALASSAGREALSSKFAFTATHSLVSYVTEKNENVVLMSTLHKDDVVSCSEDRQPRISQDYNRYKGGVASLDQLTGPYSCKRVTPRWQTAVLHDMLDVSASNAYVVWLGLNPGWKRGKNFKRRLFLAELAKALVTPLIQRRQHPPRTPACTDVVHSLRGHTPVYTVLAPVPAPPPPRPGPDDAAFQKGVGKQYRKRCKLCLPRDIRTCLTCYKCDSYVCKTHADLVARCKTCAAETP